MKVLFVNHSALRCGVADYGRRLFDILKKSELFEFTSCSPAIVLYNYHHATITDNELSSFITSYPNAIHIALYHEGPISHVFNKIIRVEDLPRPLFNDAVFEPGEYLTIGTFGFGFGNKGYSRIAQMVKDQFKDEDYVALRMHIPSAEFGDKDGQLAANEIQKVVDILDESNVALYVSTEYKTHKQLLRWLHENDLNLFLYDDMPGRGLSSTIDYALSVKRPIGISNSCMFRHIYKPEIDANLNSLQSIIDRGIEPLREAYEQNSNQKLIEYFERELCTE